MSNIISKNIVIIPAAASRPEDCYDGATLTEENITTLIRALTDEPNFVISYKGGILKFVMDGHYFSYIVPSETSDLYATLKYDDKALSPYRRLKGDSDTGYLGIEFKDSPKDSEDFALLIDGEVPEASRVRFNSQSISEIDGGEV